MELLCTYPDGFRDVNNREAEALKYTFGSDVGKGLIRIIEVEYDPSLAEGNNKGYFFPFRDEYPYLNAEKVRMRSDYNPENLAWLGIFIHEAVHAWQANTWHHLTGGGRGYDYDEEQLKKVDLGREQIARAVQDWFYVKYGIRSGLIGGKNQVDGRWVWRRIMKIFQAGEQYQPQLGRGLPYLETTYVDPNYQALMDKVRKQRARI